MSAEGWAVAEDRTSPTPPSASSTTHLGLLSSRTQSRAPKPLPDCQHPTAFPTSSVLSFITLVLPAVLISGGDPLRPHPMRWGAPYGAKHTS